MNSYDTLYDVIVCGGGTSGVAAAVSSARAGAKTLLIERTGSLGGQMSVSGPPGFAYARLFNCYGEQDTAGFVEETHQRLYKAGHALPHLRPAHRSPGISTIIRSSLHMRSCCTAPRILRKRTFMRHTAM